jgi:hypothetical protein
MGKLHGKHSIKSRATVKVEDVYTLFCFTMFHSVFFRVGSRMQKKKLDKIYTNTNYKEALN